MYFIAFLGHFEVKILKKYVKFCENSQSTNILPQIWLKVQILLPPPPCPGIFEEYIPPGVPTSFVGTALFPQGLWEQEIGSLLAVPTNLWEQLFPQRLWEHQMGVSHWLFPQICRSRLLYIILHPGVCGKAIGGRGFAQTAGK